MPNAHPLLALSRCATRQAVFENCGFTDLQAKQKSVRFVQSTHFGEPDFFDKPCRDITEKSVGMSAPFVVPPLGEIELVEVSKFRLEPGQQTCAAKVHSIEIFTFARANPENEPANCA